MTELSTVGEECWGKITHFVAFLEADTCNKGIYCQKERKNLIKGRHLCSTNEGFADRGKIPVTRMSKFTVEYKYLAILRWN